MYSLVPSPGGSTAPATDSVWQSPEVVAALIGAPIALIGIIAGIVVGVVQWRKGQRFQRQLERERAEHEDRLARERVKWETAHQQTTAAEVERKAEEAGRLALSMAADERERAALTYKRSLIDELKALKVLDMAKPLDLNALYVQVKIRQDESRRYVADEEIEVLSAGHPAALLDATAARTVAQHSDAVAPEDALIQYQHVVILGDPGAGKTTMLKHLAFRICRGEIDGLTGIPIFVELRRFIDSGMDDLLEFALRDCAEKHGFAGAGEYLREQLAEGTSALLFDGLDEVLGGTDATEADDAYRKAAGEISRLCTRYPKAPIAMTCRRAGFKGGLERFQTLEVLDFTWDQSRRFLDNWFTGRPTECRDLVQALQHNVRMKTLAANPLILSLIAIVYENDLQLPERRAELYNRCVEVLLKEWDSKRTIKRYSRFTTDRKRDLLEELAWHFHVRGKRYFPRREVLDLIAEFLPTIGLDGVDPAEILYEIEANYGLLKEQAHGWYGFWHLTVQEYFTAVWVNEHFAENREHVLRHRHDPWWEEVILLLAGRMSDATDLLLGIAGRGDGNFPQQPPIVADDDVLHGDLLLLGRCLLAMPRIRRRGLREAIIESLWSTFADSQGERSTWQTARILAALSGPEVWARKWPSGIMGHPIEFTFIRALGEFGNDSEITSMLDQLINEGDFNRYWILLSAAHERGYVGPRHLLVKAIDSAIGNLNLTGVDDLIKVSLGMLADVDADSAVDRLDRIMLEVAGATKKSSSLNDDYVIASVGAGCAAVAARFQQRRFLNSFVELSRYAVLSVDRADYALALLALVAPGEEEEIIDAIINVSGLYVEIVVSKMGPFWTESMELVALRCFGLSSGHECWAYYDFLSAAPIEMNHVRAAFGAGADLAPEVVAGFSLLLARGGDRNAAAEVRDSFHMQLASRSIESKLASRQAAAMIGWGDGRFVREEIAAFLRGLDSPDRAGLDSLIQVVRLLLREHRDPLADDIYRAFERFLPMLREERAELLFEALNCSIYPSTVERILDLSLPWEELSEGVSRDWLFREMSQVVESRHVSKLLNLARRYPSKGAGAPEFLALERLNYRLFADGRLEPGVPQDPDSRWTSTS